MSNQPETSKFKPLIDADMLRYEVGYGVQFNEQGGTFIHNFDSALELLEHKLNVIQEETWATEPPTLYLTDDKRVPLRSLPRDGDYVPVFREARAKTQPYKGNRVSEKPFHYYNLTAYMLNHYDCKVAYGIEADDLLSIDQNQGHDEYETIICSRDKDLRITPGKHYSWPCGKIPGIKPYDVEPLGTLQMGDNGKLFGTGLKFFYAQMIMGDPVDNIPGIPKKGPVAAYKLLEECEDEGSMLERVCELYSDYTEDWEDYFQEQADLLWIIQELDAEGNPVFYNKNDRSKDVTRSR